MMKFIINLLMLLAVSLPAHAATYYVKDCQIGAYTGCTPGSDAADGLSDATAWQTEDRARTGYGAANPGDRILFAKGGRWTFANNSWSNASATASNPIVVSSYTPPFCDATCLASNTYKYPQLVSDNIDFPVMWFSGSGNIGTEVTDLQLNGTGLADQPCLFVNTAGHKMNIHDNVFNGCDVGAHIGQNTNGVKFQRNIVTNNPGQGVLWSGNAGLVQYNTLDNNGSRGTVFYHNLYNDSVEGYNNIFAFNVSTRNALVGGICTATQYVFHGRQHGMIVEGNKAIVAETELGNNGCYAYDFSPSGIPQPEAFYGTKVIRNLSVNSPGFCIAIRTALKMLVERNQCVNLFSSTEYYGIGISGGVAGNAIPVSNTLFRNNTVYVQAGTVDTGCFTLGLFGAALAGNGMQATGNLCWFGSGVHANAAFWNIGNRTISDFITFDKNFYYSQTGSNRWSAGDNSTIYLTRAAAAAAGFDVNSPNITTTNPVSATPNSGDNWRVRLTPGSAPTGAGPTVYVTPIAYGGCNISGITDMGAEQVGCP